MESNPEPLAVLEGDEIDLRLYLPNWHRRRRPPAFAVGSRPASMGTPAS